MAPTQSLILAGVFPTWEHIAVGADFGQGTQDNNFTVTGLSQLAQNIHLAELIDVCLAENSRRLGAYGRRLKQPLQWRG